MLGFCRTKFFKTQITGRIARDFWERLGSTEVCEMFPIYLQALENSTETVSLPSLWQGPGSLLLIWRNFSSSKKKNGSQLICLTHGLVLLSSWTNTIHHPYIPISQYKGEANKAYKILPLLESTNVCSLYLLVPEIFMKVWCLKNLRVKLMPFCQNNRQSHGTS